MLHINYEQAKKLWFPGCKLKVEFEYNPSNMLLCKITNTTSVYTYPLMGVEERGCLIGMIGHLQLIEWEFITNIY